MFVFFIIIIIAIIAIVIWQQFRDVFYRISEIERRLDFLGRKIATDAKATSAEAEQVPVVSPETIPPSPPSHELSESESIILASLSRSSRTREEWEALIGGKLLNRIGALALIIGIGFFLKYAFDKHWLTETMRVLIGIVIGTVLLWVGSRSYKKELRIFAQGLIGAGISILYLSVYASFNFYHLVPQVIAFLMMSVVTVITFSR